MDRDWLARKLEGGASYEAIAREAGFSASKVSYWAKKYGLNSKHIARSAPIGAPNRDLLEGMVDEGLSVRAIGERLGRSPATVRFWLARYDLRTAATAKRAEARARHARAAGDLRECARHGITRHFPRASGYRCSRCAAEHVVARRRRVKAILVAEAGGACVRCGYDRSLRALGFHHLDPADKRFALGSRGLARSLAATREEAAKCVLLCSNCHAEVEDGAPMSA